MRICNAIHGVIADIEKQAVALEATGAHESAIAVRQVQSQLSLILIDDEERAAAAALDAEAHEIFASAKRLVRLAETSRVAAVERALGALQAAAMDDLEDDDIADDGTVLVRRGEDAAAFLSVARMIARRSDPEAWWRQIDEDHEENGVFFEGEEARSILRRHFGKGE